MIDLELIGKIAIVTGGSDCLGRATAKGFALEGAKVIICARREEYLMTSAKSLSEETCGTVICIQADVSSGDDCTKLIKETVQQFGYIDILVNNAGSALSRDLKS